MADSDAELQRVEWDAPDALVELSKVVAGLESLESALASQHAATGEAPSHLSDRLQVLAGRLDQVIGRSAIVDPYPASLAEPKPLTAEPPAEREDPVATIVVDSATEDAAVTEEVSRGETLEELSEPDDLEILAALEPQDASPLAHQIIRVLRVHKKPIKADTLVGMIQIENDEVSYGDVHQALREIGGSTGILATLGLSGYWIDQEEQDGKKQVRVVGFRALPLPSEAAEGVSAQEPATSPVATELPSKPPDVSDTLPSSTPEDDEAQELTDWGLSLVNGVLKYEDSKFGTNAFEATIIMLLARHGGMTSAEMVEVLLEEDPQTEVTTSEVDRAFRGIMRVFKRHRLGEYLYISEEATRAGVRLYVELL